MRLNQYIKYKLKNLSNLDLENPLLELRYILQEKFNFSLEDQIFKKELEINKSQISELIIDPSGFNCNLILTNRS